MAIGCSGEEAVAPIAIEPAEEDRHDNEEGERETNMMPTLSLEVEDGFLRGVPINRVLTGFGHVFASKQGGPTDYEQSVPVSKLDDFVSHDWNSSRLEKFMTLCLIHNGPAASACSILTAMVTHVLQSKAFVGVLPYARPYDPDVTDFTDYTLHYGIWAQLLCPLVFTVVYFEWQYLKSLLQRNVRLVFVDKLCIDQMDRAKKMKGIRQLAGFLVHSDRFVICWSRQYFTRLWCLFELAGWLHQNRSLQSVVFVPLSYGVIVYMTVLFLSLMSLSVTFASPLSPAMLMSLLGVLFFTMTPPFVPLLRNIVHHLRLLPTQIDNFTVMAASCHCCDVNHKEAPAESGDRIPCDRALIYRTLTKWFPPSGSPSDAHPSLELKGDMVDVDPRSLQQFDDSVRKMFRSFVLARVGPTKVSYPHAVMGSLPYVWRACDVAVAFGTYPDASVVAWAFFKHLVLAGATIPAVYKLIIHAASLQDKLVGKPQAWWKNALANLSLSVIAVSLMMLVYAPMEMGGSYEAQPMLQLPVWLAQIFLVGLCYGAVDCSCCRKGKRIKPIPD
eukprot:gb/GFBE01040532.1/.p1 GENE.gb/GFBE01040532.1/~~gb/GFBE01040532.1/.p1  ORF type:complete len:557 (+),score=76.24 gb/GFBE01040532.1/:1-1671(+)